MSNNSGENKVLQLDEEKSQHHRYEKWAWKLYYSWPISALSLRPELEDLVVRFPDTAERIKQLKEL